MPVLNFPTNPSVDQQYSFGGKTWYWTGSAWRLLDTGAINDIPVGNVTPSTGDFTELTSVGNISATGNITGAFLYGNGRYLTGISGGGGGNSTNIHSGTTIVDIPVPSGNVEITVDGISNVAVFSTTQITVGANIVPNTDNLTVGTPEQPFAEGYFSGNSVWVGNAKLSANTTGVTITNPQGGEFYFTGTTDYDPYANANATALLANFGSNAISTTGNITAANFFGNVTGNLRVEAANTEILFSNDGQAVGSPHLTFDDDQNILNVSGSITAVGNVQAANFVGNGVGLTSTLVDQGTDTNNWNTLTQMGVYTVNRVSWSGTEGTPLDSQVYVGLLEVKTSQTQTTTQIFYPGQVNATDIKVQWNRNLWASSWTPWVKMTNDGQLISGGEF